MSPQWRLPAICTVLLLGLGTSWAQESPWVAPIEPQEFEQVKGGLTQSPAGATKPLETAEVKETLRHLGDDEWAILQALEIKGYLPETDLDTQVIPKLSRPQINALIDQLVANHLIRTAGVEPQRMLMLSEPLLRTLTGIKPKPTTPLAP